MSVMAGFGGQEFRPEMLPRLQRLRAAAGPPVLTFDTANDFNVFAASRLAWDPSLDMDALWSEWASRKYGAQTPGAVAALKRSAEIAGRRIHDRLASDLQRRNPRIFDRGPPARAGARGGAAPR